MVLVRVTRVVHDRVSRERSTWLTKRSLTNDGFVDKLGAGDVLRKLAGLFTRPAGVSMAFEPEEGVARHFSFVSEYPYHAPQINDIPVVRRIDVLEDMPEELPRHRLCYSHAPGYDTASHTLHLSLKLVTRVCSVFMNYSLFNSLSFCLEYILYPLIVY